MTIKRPEHLAEMECTLDKMKNRLTKAMKNNEDPSIVGPLFNETEKYFVDLFKIKSKYLVDNKLLPTKWEVYFVNPDEHYVVFGAKYKKPWERVREFLDTNPEYEWGVYLGDEQSATLRAVPSFPVMLYVIAEDIPYWAHKLNMSIDFEVLDDRIFASKFKDDHVLLAYIYLVFVKKRYM